MDTESISGTVIITAAALDTISSMVLDLDNNMTVLAVAGDAVRFEHAVGKLAIDLDRKYNKGEKFSVSVSYNGIPLPTELGGLTFKTHLGTPIISSISEPYSAKSWWPSKDIPKDKADSADIRITAPSELTSVSNGKLISITENNDGTSTTHWHESYPIATYLISVAISNYVYEKDIFVTAEGDTLPIELWVYPESHSFAMETFWNTKDMIAIYDSLFGHYPFEREKYGMAQFQCACGGMEHQTVSSMATFSLYLNAHELAHQWWGDMITCASWGHIWLNEGFATYSVALWEENYRGKNYLKTYMLATQGPFDDRSIYTVDTTDVSNIFNRIVYRKGSWVLHMLRGIIGDDLFFASLREYRVRYGMDVATTENFQDVVEEVSGRDLNGFFNRWIYGKGRPLYRWTWWQTKLPSGEYELIIEVEQTQSSPLFNMPIQFKLTNTNGDSIVTVADSLATQRFKVILVDSVKDLIFDPDVWLLHEKEFYATDVNPKIPLAFELKQNYPNPFNPATLIEYVIPRSSDVKLEIYSLRGELVSYLVNDFRPAGYHSVTWNASNMSSGIYFYRLQANDFVQTKKMVLLK